MSNCKDCRHWHSKSADDAIGDQVAVAAPDGTGILEIPRIAAPVRQPVQGECRERLHVFPIVARPGQLQIMAVYPNVPENWQTCGQFEERQ